MRGFGISPVGHSPISAEREYGPSLPKDLKRIGENVDNTPNFSAYVLSFKPRQIRGRFLLTQNGSSVGTVDSSLINQGGTVDVEYPSSLPAGNYEVTVLAVDDLAKESEETQELQFTITDYVEPLDAELTWHVHQTVLTDEEIYWNVTIPGQRDFDIKWRVKQAPRNDFNLRWRLFTYWRRVNYEEHEWERVH